jgi:hypothetical protein
MSHLPKLTSVTIEDHRTSIAGAEGDMIKAFSQVNSRLKFIGVRYFPWTEWQEIVWQAASPSIVESSRDIKGETCIWTPDPSQMENWDFWLDTFGEPSVTREAMLERWPGSHIPSVTELISYTGWQ